MKAVFVLLCSMFIAGQVFATGGIDCKSIDGTMEIFTDEARIEGDNVILLGVIAPWIQDGAIIFSKANNEVNMTREEGIVYMASNAKGESLTFALDSEEREGILVSKAYFKAAGQVFVETLVCASNE